MSHFYLCTNDQHLSLSLLRQCWCPWATTLAWWVTLYSTRSEIYFGVSWGCRSRTKLVLTRTCHNSWETPVPGPWTRTLPPPTACPRGALHLQVHHHRCSPLCVADSLILRFHVLWPPTPAPLLELPTEPLCFILRSSRDSSANSYQPWPNDHTRALRRGKGSAEAPRTLKTGLWEQNGPCPLLQFWEWEQMSLFLWVCNRFKLYLRNN